MIICFLRKYSIFFIILAAFIVTRLCIILFFIDTIYNPRDDLYIGFIAQKIYTLRQIPLLDFTMSHREIFQIVPALLSIPFIFIFGNNYLAIKLLCLFLSAMNLIVWFIVLRSYSHRAAIIFCLIYTFSPVVFTNTTLMIWPAQFFVSLFLGLSLLIFMKLLVSQTKMKQICLFALLGFISGLGSWFYYAYSLLIPIVLFFLILYRKQSKILYLKIGLIFFAFFFILGFLPWFFYNLEHSFAGVFIHGETVFAIDLKNFMLNVKRILILLLPNLFFYRNPFLKIGSAYFILLVLCFGIILLKLLSHNAREHLIVPKVLRSIVLIYCAMYLFFLCSANICVRGRYLFPLFPIIFSILAMATVSLPRGMLAFFMALMVIAHLFSYWDRTPYMKFFQGVKYPADSDYGEFGRVLSAREYNVKKFYQVLETFPDSKKYSVLLWYLQDKYSFPEINFNELVFIMDKYRNNDGSLMGAFSEAFLRGDIDSGAGFRKRIESAINICGKARFADWKKIILKSTDPNQVIAAVDLLNFDKSREILFNYLGRLVYIFKREEFFHFYTLIPADFRYTFTEGYAFEDIDRLPEDIFFETAKGGNPQILLARIHDILTQVALDKQEVCKKDLCAAYFAAGYMLCSISVEDDYMVVPINIKEMKNAISTLESSYVPYVYSKIRAEHIFFKGIFEEHKIKFLRDIF